MIRTHTLDLTPDAPRPQNLITIQLLIKDKILKKLRYEMARPDLRLKGPDPRPIATSMTFGGHGGPQLERIADE